MCISKISLKNVFKLLNDDFKNCFKQFISLVAASLFFAFAVLEFYFNKLLIPIINI